MLVGKAVAVGTKVTVGIGVDVDGGVTVAVGTGSLPQATTTDIMAVKARIVKSRRMG